MRKTLISFLFAAAAVPAIGQTATQIGSIRAEVSLINKNAAKYQKKTKNVDDISLEGTEATYFTSGRGLRKITAKMYGETFRATAELFFSGEELIFAYKKLERYDTHIAMNPPPKVIKIIETRVYFAGGKAIRVMEGKVLVSGSAAEFGDAEAEMKELAEKLKDAYLN
jgi:hypothetical protein